MSQVIFTSLNYCWYHCIACPKQVAVVLVSTAKGFNYNWFCLKVP